MRKYINFNNLRKKKEFVGGGVVVEWNSPLWKHKKQLRKQNKKRRENTKNNLLFEHWKNNENIFLLF